MTTVELPAHDHAGRRERLRSRLDDLGVDALLVTAGPDLRYLTGLDASAGVLCLRRDGDDLLVVDDRYELIAAAVVPDLPREVTRHDTWLPGAVREGETLGVDGATTSWDRVRQLTALLAGRHVRAASGAVAAMRMRKDDAEAARLAWACAITDAVLAAVPDWLAVGLTEIEVARRIETDMVDRGADGISFAAKVAAGIGGAEPHHNPGSRPLAAGDLVTIDCGAAVDGYGADCTRVFSLGEPAPELTRIAEAVIAAQAAGVDAVAPGVTGGEVDAACRAVLDAAGLGETFRHGTGHGVGLELHEAPRLSRDSTDRLEVGMAVTVEPGAYVDGLGGARVEDVVAVTAEGPVRLTSSPRDLVIC